MNENTAWLSQAKSDRIAAECHLAQSRGLGYCHAVAKWQQTVEKAIKAIVCSLHEAGLISHGPLPRHSVAVYIKAMLRLPRAPGNRPIQNQLQGLLDQQTKAGIEFLDSLVPSLPTRKNTEYPYEPVTGSGNWTYPGAEGVFADNEVARFRTLAHRILDGADRILLAIRRRPK